MRFFGAGQDIFTICVRKISGNFTLKEFHLAHLPFCVFTLSPLLVNTDTQGADRGLWREEVADMQ